MANEIEQREFAVIDCETSLIKDSEIPRTKFWGYADSRGYEYFRTTEKLLKFLKGQEPKTLLHHSNFDVIQLLIDGTRLEILKSHDQRLIKCKMQNHILLNSLSCFPVALKKIFKAFGFTKTDLGELRKRNYEDCVNGLKCFMELDQVFQELVLVSPLNRGTIAATGFAAAEKFAGKMPKDLRFLEAYRGGRVEVFDMRKLNCSNYDIHSSYPQSFMECPGNDELWRVRVKTRDWHCPLYDTSNTDMLLFPNGVFESYVFRSNWERYIEPNSENTSIRILSRDRIDFSWIVQLRELVKTIYEKKRISEGAIELCCKLLLNSLYGRIGLRGESERARILDYRPDADDITVYPLGKKRWLAFDKIERESRSNFPFAAFITDNARARLFAAFKRNDPAYGDTDSIFTTVTKQRFNETRGDGLGEWGDKGHSEPFEAFNVKDYRHGCFACYHTGKVNGKKCETCHGTKFIGVRKGGDEHTIWTLKQFARGKTAQLITRTRQTGLRKRIVNQNLTTDPLVVG